MSGERAVCVDGVSEVSTSEKERKESERRELEDVPEHSQETAGRAWAEGKEGLGTLGTLGEWAWALQVLALGGVLAHPNPARTRAQPRLVRLSGRRYAGMQACPPQAVSQVRLRRPEYLATHDGGRVQVEIVENEDFRRPRVRLA